MEAIVDFFAENKEGLIDFIDKINVNRNKTLIKVGAIDNEQLSLTFYIYGEPDLSIRDYTSKIECLFDCNNTGDLPTISQYIKKLPPGYSFQFSPFLKISKGNEPTLHAFHIILDYETDENR